MSHCERIDDLMWDAWALGCVYEPGPLSPELRRRVAIIDAERERLIREGPVLDLLRRLESTSGLTPTLVSLG